MKFHTKFHFLFYALREWIFKNIFLVQSYISNITSKCQLSAFRVLDYALILQSVVQSVCSFTHVTLKHWIYPITEIVIHNVIRAFLFDHCLKWNTHNLLWVNVYSQFPTTALSLVFRQIWNNHNATWAEQLVQKALWIFFFP